MPSSPIAPPAAPATKVGAPPAVNRSDRRTLTSPTSVLDAAIESSAFENSDVSSDATDVAVAVIVRPEPGTRCRNSRAPDPSWVTVTEVSACSPSPYPDGSAPPGLA